jgi:hypothetical protein
MDTQPAFEIEVTHDGSLRISGAAAATTVLRLALAAKFQTELKWDHLLSPFVNQIIDALTKVLPLEPEDWSNPATLTPPEFLEAVEVMRSYRRVHEPDADLTELVRTALSPFSLPVERLGL